MTRNTEPKEKLWTRQFTLLILVNFTSFMVHYILMVSSPLFIRSLGGSNIAIGLATGCIAFSALAARPPLGYILDNFPHKPVLLLGMVPFCAAIGLLNFTHSIGFSLVIRVIQGIGFSAISTATATMVAATVPQSRLGEGLGFYSVAIIVSNAIGPFIALFIIDRFGYNTLFLSLAPPTLLVVLISLFLHGQKYGRPERENRKETSGNSAGFIKKMLTIEKSAIPASGMMVFASITYGGVITFLTPFGYDQGIGNMQFFFIVFSCTVVISRIITSRLSDIIDSRFIIIPCTALAAAALLLTAWSDSIRHFVIVAVLYGLGYGSLQPVYNAIAVKSSPANRKGAATATFFISMDLGIGGGSILLGFLSGFWGLPSVFIISTIIICFSFPFLFLLKPGNSGKTIDH